MPTKWTRADSPTNEPWLIRAFSTAEQTAWAQDTAANLRVRRKAPSHIVESTTRPGRI